VHLHRVDVGAIEKVFVGRGVIGANRLDQLELAQNLAADGLRSRGRGRSAVRLIEVGS
jgi:hypothetical protein